MTFRLPNPFAKEEPPSLPSGATLRAMLRAGHGSPAEPVFAYGLIDGDPERVAILAIEPYRGDPTAAANVGYFATPGRGGADHIRKAVVPITQIAHVTVVEFNGQATTIGNASIADLAIADDGTMDVRVFLDRDGTDRSLTFRASLVHTGYDSGLAQARSEQLQRCLTPARDLLRQASIPTGRVWMRDAHGNLYVIQRGKQGRDEAIDVTRSARLEPDSINDAKILSDGTLFVLTPDHEWTSPAPITEISFEHDPTTTVFPPLRAAVASVRNQVAQLANTRRSTVHSVGR